MESTSSLLAQIVCAADVGVPHAPAGLCVYVAGLSRACLLKCVAALICVTYTPKLDALKSAPAFNQIPLQNLVDGVDVPLSMTRPELATLCEAELGKIKSLVRVCIEEASTDVGSLAGAQAFGGGCRMPIVQDAIREEVTTWTTALAALPGVSWTGKGCEGTGGGNVDASSFLVPGSRTW